MALVPRYQSQTQPNTGDAPLQSVQTDARAFGASVAQALGQAGQTADAIGSEIHQRALIIQDQNNQIEQSNIGVAYSDAMTKHLMNDDNSFYNLKEKAAYDAFPQATQDLEGLRQQFIGSASNPKVRELVDMNTRRLTQLQIENMSRYARQQRDQWITKSDDAAINSAVKLGGQAQTDADFANAKATLQTAVTAKGVHNGWAPDVTADTYAQHLSTLNEVHARALSVESPTKALDWARQTEKDGGFYSDTGPKIIASLTELARPDMAEQAATRAINGTIGATMSVDDMDHIIVSAGEHGKNGQVSPKGALGEGQVLPSTAAWMANTDPELKAQGIKFNPADPLDRDKLQNDPEFNALFRKAYIRYLNGRYQGDPILTAVGYVAGPGSADHLMQANGDPRSVGYAEWLSKIPANMPQTQAYGQRVLAAIQGGTGTIQTRAAIRGQIPEIDQSIDSMGLDSRTAQLAKSRAHAVVQDQTIAAQAQQDTATQYVLSRMLPDGLHNVPLATLLKDPEFQSQWNAIPEQSRLHFATTDMRLNNDPTPERMDNYGRLVFEARNDFKSFMKEDLDTADLTNGQRQQLYSLRAQQAAKPNGGGKDLSVASVLADPRIKTALVSAGIAQYSTDKNGDQSYKILDQNAYNNFGGRLVNAMEARPSGKPMTHEEAVQAANQFFVTKPGYQNMLFGAIPVGAHHPASLQYQSGSVPQAIQGMPIDDYSQVHDILSQRYPGMHVTSTMVYNAWKAAGGHN